MRKGAGKSKGSAFERDVAKRLSLWLTGGKDKKQLIRTVLSGGWRAGQGDAEGWRQVGDLAANGPVGEQFRRRFAVECKHHRTIDLLGLWTRTDYLKGWWEKLNAEITEHTAAGETPMVPLLVFRANNRPVMAGLPTQAADWLRINSAAHFKWMDLAIFPFEDLLRCSPTRVLEGSMR